MSRDPVASVTLRHGDTLTLTCTIQLDPEDVDTDVGVTGTLSGPGGTAMNPVSVMNSSLTYQITLELTNLQATASSDTYTCMSTASPGPSAMNLMASEQGSIMLGITVGKDPQFSILLL